MQPGYEINIDWMWGNTARCGKPVCLGYVVREANPTLIRGPLSAKECVKACIVSLPTLGLETAVRWLMAGQAHNPAAQTDLWNNQVAAVTYTIVKYGPLIGGFTFENTLFSPKDILDSFSEIKTKDNVTWADVMDSGPTIPYPAE